MNKFKAYPVNEAFAPEERAKMGGLDVSRKIYNSYADGILMANESSFIEHMLESIVENVGSENYEAIEEFIEAITAVIDGSRKKMEELHTLLGAFDGFANGGLSKPESEKISWDSANERMPPNLRPVK